MSGYDETFGIGSDEVMARLRDQLRAIEQLPVADRADRFEAVNTALTEELGRLDEI